MKNITTPTLYTIIWVGVFLCCIVTNALSQDLTKLYNEADSLYKSKKTSEADSLYRFIQPAAANQELWKTYYYCSRRIITNAINKKEIEGLPKTIKNYASIFPSSEDTLKYRLYTLLPFFYLEIGRKTNAIYEYEKILPFFKSSNDTAYVQYILGKLCLSYLQLDDNQSAIKYSKEGQSYLDHLKNKKYFDFVFQEGMAYFYNQEYAKAKEIYQKLLKVNHNTNLVHLRLAQCYIQEDSLDLGMGYLRRVDSDMYPYEYLFYKSLYDEKKGNLNLAIQDIEELIAFTLHSNEPRNHLKALVRLAKLSDKNNVNEKSVSYAHEAMVTFQNKMDPTDIWSRPENEDIFPEIWMIEASYLKAKYFINLQKLGDQKAKEEATFYFNYMFQIYDEIKKNQLTLESKYQTGAYSQSMYNTAISFFLSEYKETGQELYFEKANQIAQLSNAYVLRNIINERQALEYANVPDSLILEFLRLKSELMKSQNSIDKPILDSLKYPYNAIEDKIYTNYPKAKFLNSTKTLSTREIQNNLDINSLLIRYKFVNKKMYAFIFSKNTYELLEKEITQADYTLLKQFSQYPANDKNTNQHEDRFIKDSKAVYDLLLSPILSKSTLSHISKLTIIPDGPIKQISLSTLLNKETDSWSDVNSYLISEYSINYLYYLSQIDSDSYKNTYDNTFVGFGIQYTDKTLEDITSDYIFNYNDSLNLNNERTSSLMKLNKADDEVINCAKICNGEYWINESVTKELISSKIRNSQIAHFAVHSLVDPINYKNSFIALDGHLNDNKFGYEEILSLEKSPELVVLSACQTSIGQNIEGEGVMSISRMFSNSGSKACLGSYWNVPDKPSQIFMELFYENLLRNMSSSEAMRQAQLSYLSDDNLTSPSVRAPYYWAGWTLYGNEVILDNRKPNYGYYSLLLLFVTIPIFYFLALRKKKKMKS